MALSRISDAPQFLGYRIEAKNYLAPQVRDNSDLRLQFHPAEVCRALTTGSAGK
jgi:hypothetical protein